MFNIKRNRIIPQTVDVCFGDDFFATVNEYELNDIRIQIKETGAENFSVIFKDEHIPINSDGTLSSWPPGLFDLMADQLDKLNRWP